MKFYLIASFLVYRSFKRCADLSLALFMCIPFSIFLLFYYPIGKRYFGALLFKQVRIGKGEKPFYILKLKTMRQADALQSAGWLGTFLRKYSIDELPQIVNIIRGEMSFVGPRPLLEEYLPLYSFEQRKRHLVRPGVTGLAQVTGRNAISWREKFEMDVWYIANRSFTLDLKILFKTVITVFAANNINTPYQTTMEKFDGTN